MDQHNHRPGAATSGGRRRSARVIGVTATIGLLQLAVTPALGAQASNIARAEHPAAANGAIWKSAHARLPQGLDRGPRGVSHDAMTAAMRAATAPGAATAGAVDLRMKGGDGYDGANHRSGGLFGATARGGKGGAGSSRSVSIHGAPVVTSAEGDAGVRVWSSGGRGGRGGDARAASAGLFFSGAYAEGGAGGDGGDGGDVFVNNAATIVTSGDHAAGISARSAGGDGGEAISSATAIGFDIIPSIAVDVNASGHGGRGGDGKTVTVVNTGDILTLGNGSHGISGESVGGAGGAHGYTQSASELSFGYTYARSRDAGGAGDGGRVDLTNDGATIMTRGDGSYGIHGMSLGGDGGDGGTATAAADVLPVGGAGVGGAATKGGRGGAGGDGDLVTVSNRNGVVITTGDRSSGVVAQSIGGGGGNGGAVVTAAGPGVSFGELANQIIASQPDSAVATAQVDVGGRGGAGGAGGDVIVTNAGDSRIETRGTNAHGVLAQSIGGGGGRGGAVFNSGDSPLDMRLAIGGAGGGGGDGGKAAVTIERTSTVVTRGAASHGVFAQSVGGGDGDGGAFRKSEDDESSTGFISQIERLAGREEAPDPTEELRFDHDYSLISTGIKIGKKIAGVEKAESPMPDVSARMHVGGAGGDGGDGGEANVSNDGAVFTAGTASHGVFAQSVGGGGGAGAVAGAPVTGSKYRLNVTVGGEGGAGGDGGRVVIANSGEVRTDGDGSFGVFGQSTGGGGGFAGDATSPGPKRYTLNVGIGGSGGGGGDGGDVEISNAGRIQTQGAGSHGVVAQSVGGGGGAAVLGAPEKAAPFFTDVDKLIDTLLINAGDAIAGSDSSREAAQLMAWRMLQPAGATIRIGGTGGAGGDGGLVSVKHDGDIATSGDGAAGVVAQSVGGGGGIYGAAGGFDPLHGYNVITLGGSDNAGGDGGAVEVTVSADATITTWGKGAHGIVAQSVGGGGGYVSGADGANVTVADEKASGDGGDVSVNSGRNARIAVYGAGANGVYAQSIGGGGGAWASGAVPDATDPAARRRSQATGHGGRIDITWRGSITATGENANAILAQTGRQMTNGAIDPTSQGGPVTIDLDDGQYIGGSGKGAAIRIDGGGTGRNAVTTINIGANAEVAALSGTAIIASAPRAANITVEGVLTGDVLLNGRGQSGDGPHLIRGPGPVRPDGDAMSGALQDIVAAARPGHQEDLPASILRVNNSGVYRSLAGHGVVDLGPGGLFEIADGGTLDIGGNNSIASLSVTGDLNLKGGRMPVDVNVDTTTGERRVDAVSVTGALSIGASADGQPTVITVNVMDALLPGDYVIFNKAPATAGPVEVSGVDGSPVSWTISDGGQAIAPRADFIGAAAGMPITRNEMDLAGGLQQAWNDGALSDAPLFAAFAGVNSPEAYEKAMATLSPDGYLAEAQAQVARASGAMDAAMSCPDGGGGRNGAACIWGRISGITGWRLAARPDQDARHGDVSYRIGARADIAPQWWLGMSGAYVTANTNARDGHVRSGGQGGDLSVALGHDQGPWTLAAAAQLSFGGYNVAQQVTIGDRNWSARSRQEAWTAGLRLHAAYRTKLGDVDIRPFASVDAVYAWAPAFAAAGSLPAAYRFDALQDWTTTLSPGVEVGTTFQISNDVWLRPHATLGASLVLGDPALGTKAQLGAGGARFLAVQAQDRVTFDASAGISLLTAGPVEMQGEYRARLGATLRSHEALGRLTVRF